MKYYKKNYYLFFRLKNILIYLNFHMLFSCWNTQFVWYFVFVWYFWKMVNLHFFCIFVTDFGISSKTTSLRDNQHLKHRRQNGARNGGRHGGRNGARNGDRNGDRKEGRHGRANYTMHSGVLYGAWRPRQWGCKIDASILIFISTSIFNRWEKHSMRNVLKWVIMICWV